MNITEGAGQLAAGDKARLIGGSYGWRVGRVPSAPLVLDSAPARLTVLVMKQPEVLAGT